MTGAPDIRPFRSVRLRVVLWNAGVLALLFVVLGIIVNVTVRNRLMASVDRDLAARFPAFAPRPDGPPMERRGPGRGPMRPFGRMDEEFSVRMMDPAGSVLVPPGATEPWDRAAFERALRRENGFSTVPWNGGKVRVLSRGLPPNGRVDRVMQLAYPLAEVERAMAGLRFSLLAMLPVALLLAGLAGSLLTDRVLSPVRQITVAAARIEASDLGRRIPVSGNDEFARLGSAFNAMLARLHAAFLEQEQRVERERRFVADASHELRTPLTVIRANTSLALSQGGLDLKAVEDMDTAAESAARLVNDLLLLARSDAGQLGQERRAVQVGDLVRKALASRPPGDDPPVTAGTIEADLVVNANEEEMVRVLRNLLENAARHTAADGKVSVSARREAENAVLEVSDTGTGIEPQHIPHLGERFYRVDTARDRKSGGTGLGLSICRGILDAHGGSMAFSSVPGQGTTVRVTLPALDTRSRNPVE